ncbi:DTW domain-containing protein [Vibrio sp. JC009]|uniref:tRNA-uridine aminocarboxypropyltransferase n=1 Tax=Vibrio sp. JC009 TaxID=2912314 RepID=UPI0023B00348|nr:DTW domain-containing protein [Vibrio sp. JC009]WED21764.1 DTW domain-containing protein [Vibrio sp. JC009]
MTSPKKPEPCTGCGFRYQCICPLIPGLDPDWHLALLTHPNELTRDTNTGKLLEKILTNCQIHIWDRVNPPKELLQQISSGEYQPILLFPTEESIPLDEYTGKSAPTKPYLFIILDSTWQEAQKMLRKSPWIQALPAVHFSGELESGYQLRRNQKKGNLCTFEVGVELIKILNGKKETEKLTEFFNHYLSVFSADKSGHEYTLKQQ